MKEWIRKSAIKDFKDPFDKTILWGLLLILCSIIKIWYFSLILGIIYVIFISIYHSMGEELFKQEIINNNK